MKGGKKKLENPTFLKAKRAQNTQEPSDLVKMLDKSKRSESFLICFERESSTFGEQNAEYRARREREVSVAMLMRGVIDT